MKKKSFTYIIIFITITIIATIGLQVYWNLKNYDENRLRVINEVQIAFDTSIDKYYVAESKKNTISFFVTSAGNKIDINDLNLDTLFKSRFKSKINKHQKKSTIKFTDVKYSDISTTVPKTNVSVSIKKTVGKYKIYRGKKATDSARNARSELDSFSFTVNTDTIKFNEMSSLFEKELQRKNINIDYSIQHFKAKKFHKKFNSKTESPLILQTDSKSTFLPENTSLKLKFSDPTLLILKRSMTGIILSLLLSLSIIGCLVYLFKIINKQKKIDAVKNDLISNITHEFKTPITTISSAIEGIRHFNNHNDTEKTNRYLFISEQQIYKLTSMVEKLLETASLNTDELLLKKETIDLVTLLQSNIDKYQLFCPQKRFSFDCNLKTLPMQLDAFHFENVVSNLLDNAVKYGGTDIDVSLILLKKNIEIYFTDNGFGISKEHQDKIFDQFYRVAKGNVHNVKGFGIGLYYSRKIIEKHGGTLSIIPKSKTTNFKISMPNGQN